MSMTADPALTEAQPTQQAVMERIARLPPTSTAEVLRALRSAFPQMPLAARVTALEAARRAGAGSPR